MRNFFALTAAGTFFLILLIGYFNDSSLTAIIIRSVIAYLVILVLGELFTRMAGQDDFSPAEEGQAQEPREKAGPESPDEHIARMNRDIARDPQQAAKTIKGMMK